MIFSQSLLSVKLYCILDLLQNVKGLRSVDLEEGMLTLLDGIQVTRVYSTKPKPQWGREGGLGACKDPLSFKTVGVGGVPLDPREWKPCRASGMLQAAVNMFRNIDSEIMCKINLEIRLSDC